MNNEQNNNGPAVEMQQDPEAGFQNVDLSTANNNIISRRITLAAMRQQPTAPTGQNGDGSTVPVSQDQQRTVNYLDGGARPSLEWQDLHDTVLEPDQQRSERNSNIRGLLSKTIFFCVCLAMPLARYEYVKDCKTPIVVWLLVNSGIQFLGMIRHIVLIASVSKRNFKFIRQNTECLYTSFVYTFYIAWLIYGNTFHYSQDAMECRSLSRQSFSLWVLMMIQISVGYLHLAFMSCVCCLIPCLCILACRSRAMMNQVVDKIPYNAALKAITRTTFGNVGDKNDMKSCVICLMDYEETDEIAELNCDKRHFFHSKCLEDALKKKLECPICRAPIKTEKE